MGSLPTIEETKAKFRSGSLTPGHLVDNLLDRINATDGEGSKSFMEVYAQKAKQQADIYYRALKSTDYTLPLHGIPISIKDLFDILGTQTKSGSVVLNSAAPASRDALIVERLRQAGAIIIGRTTMTEFAYSGVGLNPHYGTPASPYDRKTRRIPGGSSSGSGVSVADQMAIASIGTDTGGSVRIPSALCGLTGFKPTARRVPTDGVFPLSSTFDSVGPLAASVRCCITLDQIMSGRAVRSLQPYPLNHLRIAIPKGIPLEDLDLHVSTSFERALEILRNAGVHITEVHVDAIANPSRSSMGARLLAAEAYSIHRTYLEEAFHLYDPRVSKRILPAADTSAADYIDLLSWRKGFVDSVKQDLLPYDAILMPTTPIIAPPISALEESDEVYFKTNTLMLRNTCIINQMDGCALSIPCHREGEPPVGLMLAGLPMHDEKILQVGLAVEELLKNL